MRARDAVRLVNGHVNERERVHEMIEDYPSVFFIIEPNAVCRFVIVEFHGVILSNNSYMKPDAERESHNGRRTENPEGYNFLFVCHFFDLKTDKCWFTGIDAGVL